jgi:hypothetical protein
MDKVKLHSMLLAEGQRQGLADPTVMIGIARAENGRPGREMGYGRRPDGSWSPEWRGIERQVFGSVKKVKQLEEQYEQDIKQTPVDQEGHYTNEFLLYLSHGAQAFGMDKKSSSWGGYAPLGMKHDPTGLNNNHFFNVSDIYYRMKDRLDMIPSRSSGGVQ